MKGKFIEISKTAVNQNDIQNRIDSLIKLSMSFGFYIQLYRWIDIELYRWITFKIIISFTRKKTNLSVDMNKSRSLTTVHAFEAPSAFNVWL